MVTREDLKRANYRAMGADPLNARHHKYNVDPVDYHRHVSRGLVQKFLNLFPEKSRTAVGTATGLTLGYFLYLLVEPSQKNRPLKTMTPEWEKASEAYREAQNLDPITKYKENTRK